MNGSGSFTVTNPLGINKLKITVTYSGSVPVPAPPGLRYPAHNASVLYSFQCSWQPVFGADEYILQLARDVNFTTLTLNESIVDTVKFFPYLATWGDNYWRVQAVNASGGSVYSETRRFTYMSTGIPQERAGNADGYFLGQNYPNPFNPFTTIEYRLAGEQFVELSLYDVLGRKVATLVNKAQAQGQYTIRFDASRLPSGTYFYELRVNGSRAIRKMQLNK
jgi:hypothetical protein